MVPNGRLIDLRPFFWIIFVGFFATAAEAKSPPETVSAISAPVAGSLSYDFKSNPNNGWYTDGSTGEKFQLGFKQGERASAHPVQVATVSIDKSDGYPHPPCFDLAIMSRHEDNPRSTAYYKVSLSNTTKEAYKNLIVDKSRVYDHKFAMKIAGPKFSIEDGAPVMIEEYWQGSPFSAPVSVLMISKNDAIKEGFSSPGDEGNFVLSINNDDHAPLHRFGTKSEFYDLGPIEINRWMTWQVTVNPDPSGLTGYVDVLRNGAAIRSVTGEKIGFDPNNPQYGSHRPAKVFQDVGVLLYRRNGVSYQQVLFDDISLTMR